MKAVETQQGLDNCDGRLQQMRRNCSWNLGVARPNIVISHGKMSEFTLEATSWIKFALARRITTPDFQPRTNARTRRTTSSQLDELTTLAEKSPAPDKVHSSTQPGKEMVPGWTLDAIRGKRSWMKYDQTNQLTTISNGSIASVWCGAVLSRI